jgi:hypothetical protein
VYDRTVSAYLYHHPTNFKYYKNLRQTKREKHYGPMAYICFPTLESFALLMKDSASSSCDYPYPKNVIETENCIEFACAVINGRVRLVFSHLFFNYRNILDTKLPTTPKRDIYVIRQEDLWDDWRHINQILGQTEPVVIPSGKESSVRNVSGLELPVTREISQLGRVKLCRALEPEYIAYFRLILRAVNLNENDIEDCRRHAAENCPNLDFKSIIRTIKENKKAQFMVSVVKKIL